MVRFPLYRWIILFCLMTVTAFADNAPIVVVLSKATLIDQHPIEGTVTVEHDVKDIIDVTSFTMNGKPLSTTFVKDVSITPGSPIIRSTYRFQLPGENKGLHVLAPISVRSMKGIFTSPSVAYEVIGEGERASDNQEVILQLEMVADHPEPFYLGQIARFGYRMIFNDNIELREQELPLIQADGFRKIGDLQVSDRREADKAIHQVIQVVKPINQGTFTFGPAFITGMAYREGATGRSYTTGELRADAPGVTIIVKAFPTEGKPPIFNGAVGEDLDFRVFLLTLPEMNVGDQMLLSLNISGKGDLEDIPMPDLCCQPGFPGVFKQSDLPPVDQVRGPARSYVVEMRPLTDKVTEIPPIAFSYFNSKTSKYITLTSNPIPIVVHPAPQGNIHVPPSSAAEKMEEKVNAQEQEAAVWPNAVAEAPSIEIKTIYSLSSSDMRDRYFGTWWVFLLLPFGMLALYGQMLLIQKREQEKAIPKVKDSLDFFEEAIEEKDNQTKFYHSLIYAFMLRLFECGWISKMNSGPEQLPQTGICGEVRDFLVRIEAGRFAGQGGLTPDQVAEEARALFDRIHHE